jgi:hypothetical protein
MSAGDVSTSFALLVPISSQPQPLLLSAGQAIAVSGAPSARAATDRGHAQPAAGPAATTA